MLGLFTVARQPPVVTYDNDDVLRTRLFTRHDVNHHHHQQQQQQQQQVEQQQQQQKVAYNRRLRNKQQQKLQAADSERTTEVFDIDSLSDVLLTRIFYSGLLSDDLCRCAVVCRRWNRLVWNPLLWTCINLSQAPDCDADAALR